MPPSPNTPADTRQQAHAADPSAFLDLTVQKRADGKTAVAALVVGIAFDLAVRSGIVGVGGAIAVTAAAAALLLAGWADPLANPQARALAGAAALFGVLLAVRTSPWLVMPNLAAALGLLVLSASLTRGGSVLSLSLADVLVRAANSAGHLIAAPRFLLDAAARRRHDTATTRRAGAVRGLIVAAPIIAVLAALLASADPVFASLFRLPGSAGDLVVHAVVVGVGGWAAGGLLRTSSAGPPPAVEATGLRLGRTETVVVLGSLVALFAAFGTTQLVTALGGARHVLEQNGLTFASYAREGFFQLIAVAAITAAVLAAVRAFSDIDRITLLLAEAAVALTLAIVWIALRKLRLYEQAYGLTMLRLYCQVAAVWIAFVFLLLGGALAAALPGTIPASSRRTQRNRLLPSATGIALALLVMLNAVNPEALVVRRNSTHPRPDHAYLATLSDDAAPALAEAGVPIPCRVGGREFKGWAAANWSRTRANAVRKERGVCQP